MNIKNEQLYEDSLQSLGFKISFDVGDAYDTLNILMSIRRNTWRKKRQQ